MMITLDRVSISYPGRSGRAARSGRSGRGLVEPVVSDVSFKVLEGEWLTVIGPNGAGKSTLLKAIAGLLPIEGTLTIDGSDDASSGDRSRVVAYVPQKPALPPGMTTAEYVLLGRSAHLRWYQLESANDRDRAAAVIDELDLGPLAHRPIDELSGGEAQRAALARALAQEATVLVLDEPTSALDLAHRVSVLELVDRLRRDHTLTVVTAMHDLTIAARYARQMLLLAGGRSVALGGADEVLQADVLSRWFATPVAVDRDPQGGLVVIPLRPDAPHRPDSPR